VSVSHGPTAVRLAMVGDVPAFSAQSHRPLAWMATFRPPMPPLVIFVARSDSAFESGGTSTSKCISSVVPL